MKKYQLCSIEYPILDIIYSDVKSEILTELGFNKGDVLPVDEVTRNKIVEALKDSPVNYVPGGAAANTTAAFSSLGGKSVFVARFGLDTYGKMLKEDFQSLNISNDGMIFCNEGSGICIIITTEDAERTMFPSVEAGLRLKPENLPLEVLKDSEWIFSQAYMLPYSQDLKETLYATIKICQENNLNFAFSLSAPNIVKDKKEEVIKIVKKVSLCFANEHEAFELTGEKNPEIAAEAMAKLCPHVVITAGENGVWIIKDNNKFHIPAFSCTPIDLTGAGDSFAGAYLYGLTQGKSIEESAKKANYIAMKVITNIGARLNKDLYLQSWLEA